MLQHECFYLYYSFCFLLLEFVLGRVVLTLNNLYPQEGFSVSATFSGLCISCATLM